MEPLAYWNGRWVGQSTLSVSPDDLGFLMGVTITERLRTFGGKLFRLEEHWARLRHSLELVGGLEWADLDQLAVIAQRLVESNARGPAPGDDQGLVVFLTPGRLGESKPTVSLQSYPLDFAESLRLYERGQRLVVSSHRQVPPECWSPALKCRSRMHYYLADLEARRQDPLSRALILDQRGLVAESSTANIVLALGANELVTPRREFVLPGVSLQVVEELAGELGMNFVERDVRVEECHEAGEVFLCSTSPCLVPVTAIDGRAIGTGRPGPVFDRLMAAWGGLVGIDIIEQARVRRGATRDDPERPS